MGIMILFLGKEESHYRSKKSQLKDKQNKVNKVMVIDSHQHFWKYKPPKHKWIDDSMSLIRKDFMPSDLKKYTIKIKLMAVLLFKQNKLLKKQIFY